MKSRSGQLEEIRYSKLNPNSLCPIIFAAANIPGFLSALNVRINGPSERTPLPPSFPSTVEDGVAVA